MVLVFKLDRAFRSVKHMHDTLAAWETVGVSFQSVRERFDTSTALGRLLLNLLASLAEFELELIRERVKAGMDRARRQGRHIGRPRVTDRRGFRQRYGAVLERIERKDLSRRQAARELGIGYATLKRLLDAGNRTSGRRPVGWTPNLPPEVLTSIRGMYTLATPHEAIPGDVDEVAVRHFLDTLAEVALAVASRKARR